MGCIFLYEIKQVNIFLLHVRVTHNTLPQMFEQFVGKKVKKYTV